LRTIIATSFAFFTDNNMDILDKNILHDRDCNDISYSKKIFIKLLFVVEIIMGIKITYNKSLMICDYFYVNVGVFVER